MSVGGLTSLVVFECLGLVLHCLMTLIPILTKFGFLCCFGFHIVTTSHNKMGPHFSKNCGIILACVPRLCSALSACSSVPKNRTVSECEKFYVPLPSNDSESPRIPLVAVDSSTSAASSTSRASRFSVNSCVSTLPALCHSSFSAVDVPDSHCCNRPDYHLLGARFRIAVTLIS